MDQTLSQDGETRNAYRILIDNVYFVDKDGMKTLKMALVEWGVDVEHSTSSTTELVNQVDFTNEMTEYLFCLLCFDHNNVSQQYFITKFFNNNLSFKMSLISDSGFRRRKGRHTRTHAQRNKCLHTVAQVSVTVDQQLSQYLRAQLKSNFKFIINSHA